MITIVDLERNEFGAITVVHWVANKTEVDVSASTYGTYSFDPDNESPGFIPFKDLTEEVIISWFTDEQLEAIQAALDGEIDEKKNPKVRRGLPQKIKPKKNKDKE